MANEVRTKNEQGELVAAELPQFRCHKVVRAAKIVAIAFLGEGLYRLALDGGVHVDVFRTWIANRAPAVGGYFVQYEDGYSSFSPAKAFEGGYTRLPYDEATDSASAAGQWKAYARVLETNLRRFLPHLVLIASDGSPELPPLEAQGSGSERNGTGDWTQAGDGTDYPAQVPAEALAEQAAHDAATGNIHGLPDPAGEPSAADLDAHAEEEKARIETKVYTDGTVATGTGPLPELSPAQQDTAEPSSDAPGRAE